MLIRGVALFVENASTRPTKSCVARSVKFQPGLEGSYHKRMRIKIGPSACIDCRRENSQTFLWGPPDTGPLARDFLWKRDTRGEPSHVQGERGDHGRKHLPTVPWHSDDLQDGPGNPPSVVPAGPTSAPGEPHWTAVADPGDCAEGRTSEQRPHLREDGDREDSRRQVHRERVPKGGRRADVPVALSELREC